MKYITNQEVTEDSKEVDDNIVTDVAIYSGEISNASIELFRWCSKRRTSKRNLVLFLSTTGGSADWAYRIARACQRNFHKFYIAILWICKSAGTLLCIGAHGLMFCDEGELGPLDVQIPQKDELLGRSSGLTPLHALSVLYEQSYSYFERSFLSIISQSQGQISTARAAHIAIKLTVGLYGSIYKNIDPLVLGQTTRDMSIAKDYGERLDAVANNLRDGALQRLITDYPVHGFVIDNVEAATLFKSVTPVFDGLQGTVERFLHKLKEALFSGSPYFRVIEERGTGEAPSSLAMNETTDTDDEEHTG